MSVRNEAIENVLNGSVKLGLVDNLRLKFAKNSVDVAGEIVDRSVDKVETYEEMIDTFLGGVGGLSKDTITRDMFIR